VGLGESETISDLINQRSQEYEAYPLAYLGWGPQHAWIRFKDGSLPTQVPFPKGRAVMVINENTIGRVFGDPKTLLYAAAWPLVQEISEGNFAVKGSFELEGTWWQKAQIKFCNPFLFCKRLVAIQNWKPSLAQLKTAGRMIDDIDKMYRAQFSVEDFTLLWSGSEEEMAAMRSMTRVKIIRMAVLAASPTGEPNAQGAKQAANFLFDQKLVH
jgi:hypothetical protein